MTEKQLEKALQKCFSRTPTKVKRNSFGYNRAQKNNYKGRGSPVKKMDRKEVEVLVSGNYAI